MTTDTRLKESIQAAAQCLKRHGAKEVYVFGSIASGRAGHSSDVDMAVSGLPREAFFRALSRATDVLGRPLDLIDLDSDTPFTRYLRDEGELERVQ